MKARMTDSFNTCPDCKGFGHDKAGRPVTKMIPNPKAGQEDEPDRLHVTVKQGSGCKRCLGVGFVV